MAISFGTEKVFNSASTDYVSVVYLTSTKFVVAYKDTGNSNYGTAVVGTISNGDITFGSEYVFNDDYSMLGISITGLDSSHFMIVYTTLGYPPDYTTSEYGTAIIGTISNTDEISFGSEYYCNKAVTAYISVSALDSSHCIIIYMDGGNSNYGTAIVATISNTDEISFGSEYVFNSAITTEISVSMLDSTHFVVAYRDNGNSDYGTAIIGTISGSTITYGSEYVFNSGESNYVLINKLDSSHCVISYTDAGDSNNSKAIIGTVTNTNKLSFGSEYAFNSGSISIYKSISALDSSHFIIAYCDQSSTFDGTAILGTITNTNKITFGSEYVFTVDNAYSTSVISLDSSNFVIAYRDLGNSSYGTALVGFLSKELLISEALKVSSSISKGYFRTLSDVISIISTNISLLGKNLIEVLKINEIYSKTKSLLRTLTETLKINDILSKLSTLFRSFTENIVVSSIASAIRIFLKTLSETIKVGENFIKLLGKKFVEIIKATDLSVRFFINKTFKEIINTLDHIAKKLTIKRTLTEVIKITQDIGKTMYKIFVEIISVVHTFGKFTQKVFAEVIKIASSSRKLLNGFLVGLWTKVARVSTGVWNKIKR